MLSIFLYQSVEDSTHSIFHMLENYFHAFLILNHSLVTVNMVILIFCNISHSIFLKVEMYPQVSVKTLNKDSFTKNLFILPTFFFLWGWSMFIIWLKYSSSDLFLTYGTLHAINFIVQRRNSTTLYLIIFVTNCA